MNTFKAYFKKEIKESIRHYRYIVLGVGIILFAIADPIMFKLLPEILKGQIPEGLGSLMHFTGKYVLQDYIGKELFQMGNLFIALGLMGTLSDEIYEQKLVFPYSKGCSPVGIVLSKTIHYILTVAVFTAAGFAINYYYTGLLFTGEMPGAANMTYSCMLMIVYFAFNISLIILLSSLFRKGIFAGLSSLLIIYLMPLLSNIKSISNYIPYKLFTGAAELKGPGGNMVWAIIITVICIAVFNILSIFRMNKVEIV